MQPSRELKWPRRLLQALIQLAENRPDMIMACMFKYFPHAKICSVANDATAFVRSPYGNVVNTIQWAEDTEENPIFARAASREITGMAVTGNVDLAGADSIGYGNYAGAPPTGLVEMLVLLTLWPDPEVSVGLTGGGPVNDTTIRDCKY